MMLRDGGIYNVHYSDDYDVYIVIITITEYIYYYEIDINTNNDLYMNNQDIVDTLEEQINCGLGNLHDFYIKERVDILKNKLDGYLGQITNEQLFDLTIELYNVKFD